MPLETKIVSEAEGYLEKKAQVHNCYCSSGSSTGWLHIEVANFARCSTNVGDLDCLTI